MGARVQKKFKEQTYQMQGFENVDLDVYRPQFPLNKRRVKNKRKIFLVRNYAAKDLAI